MVPGREVPYYAAAGEPRAAGNNKYGMLRTGSPFRGMFAGVEAGGTAGSVDNAGMPGRDEA